MPFAWCMLGWRPGVHKPAAYENDGIHPTNAKVSRALTVIGAASVTLAVCSVASAKDCFDIVKTKLATGRKVVGGTVSSTE
jgi:hypothetical protein